MLTLISFRFLEVVAICETFEFVDTEAHRVAPCQPVQAFFRQDEVDAFSPNLFFPGFFVFVPCHFRICECFLTRDRTNGTRKIPVVRSIQGLARVYSWRLRLHARRSRISLSYCESLFPFVLRVRSGPTITSDVVGEISCKPCPFMRPDPGDLPQQITAG